MAVKKTAQGMVAVVKTAQRMVAVVRMTMVVKAKKIQVASCSHYESSIQMVEMVEAHRTLIMMTMMTTIECHRVQTNN
jgi:hypothetical protein